MRIARLTQSVVAIPILFLKILRKQNRIRVTFKKSMFSGSLKDLTILCRMQLAATFYG